MQIYKFWNSCAPPFYCSSPCSNIFIFMHHYCSSLCQLSSSNFILISDFIFLSHFLFLLPFIPPISTFTWNVLFEQKKGHILSSFLSITWFYFPLKRAFCGILAHPILIIWIKINMFKLVLLFHHIAILSHFHSLILAHKIAWKNN